MANTFKEKELKTDYPFTSGLTAETTSQQGHVIQLVPENSLVPERKKKGIEYG